MNYAEFKDFIKDHILESLPEKFEDCQVKIMPIVKSNDIILDGLQVIGKDSNITPNIYLNPYFEAYERGRDLNSILDAIADARLENNMLQNFDVDSITDWKKVKDHISCKVVDMEMNEQFLSNKPFTQVEDLAVTYQIMLEQHQGESSAIPIHNGLVAVYGIDTETLHSTAMENMERLTPVSFKSMQEVMREIMIPDIMNEQGIDREEAQRVFEMMMPEDENPMYCLTNEAKVNGAVCILNPEVRENITQQLGGDFFVIFSSIHETLIIPKDSDMDYKELEKIIKDINENQLLPEERLSNHVYEYNAKEKEFARSDKVAERKAVWAQIIGKDTEKKSLKDKLEEKKAVVAIEQKTGSSHKMKGEPALG